MTNYTKRIYLDKQPEVGDLIEITYESMFSGFKVGTEMVIIDPKSSTGTCVQAYCNRRGKVVFVHDNWYSIYQDVTYEKVGEEHVVKRFLGIPLYRKTIDTYKEVQ
jgi:hypothetical protein